MVTAFADLTEEDSGADAQAALAECLAALPESSALLIRGRLETVEGVTNVIAETLSLLPLSATIPSRDFR